MGFCFEFEMQVDFRFLGLEAGLLQTSVLLEAPRRISDTEGGVILRKGKPRNTHLDDDPQLYAVSRRNL
jgi:hypothetical protein